MPAQMRSGRVQTAVANVPRIVHRRAAMAATGTARLQSKLKGPTMRRIFACAVAALALQGCAAANESSSPVFLGAFVSDSDAAAKTQSSESTPAALDHVQSNKVLGAMAYQKVTGRTIAPERLTGSKQP